MKRTFMMLAVSAAVITANSQTAPTGTGPLDAQVVRPGQRATDPGSILTLKTERPNQIVGPNVTYSGIAVQLAKTDNPLQLINPAAPSQYGSSEDNVARDPMDGKVTGLKIFAINF